MKLKAVHRVLSFTQSCWLKPYIEKNTNLRIKNKDSPFDYFFYKLLNNSFYGVKNISFNNSKTHMFFFTVGKTVENVFKYRNFKICSTGTQYQKLRKQPNFHRADILGENLAIVEMNRRKVTYNKPRYVGITVLNLAKVSIHHATTNEGGWNQVLIPLQPQSFF